MRLFLIIFCIFIFGCEVEPSSLSEEEIKFRYQKIEGVITDISYVECSNSVKIQFEDGRVCLMRYSFSNLNDLGTMFRLNQFHTVYHEYGNIKKVIYNE